MTNTNDAEEQKRIIMEISRELFEQLAREAGFPEDRAVDNPQLRDKLMTDAIKVRLYRDRGMTPPLSKKGKRRAASIARMEKKLEQRRLLLEQDRGRGPEERLTARLD